MNRYCALVRIRGANDRKSFWVKCASESKANLKPALSLAGFIVVVISLEDKFRECFGNEYYEGIKCWNEIETLNLKPNEMVGGIYK